MAGYKILDLTASSGADSTTWFEITQTVAGNPASRRLSATQMATYIGGSFVPYTGATNHVDLGLYSLKGSELQSIRNINGTVTIYAINDNAGANSSTAVIFGEVNNGMFSGITRATAAATGNYSSTNIPNAGTTQYICYNGAVGDRPAIINYSKIYNVSGATSTNAATVLDSVGLRIGLHSDMATANTARLELPAGTNTIAPLKLVAGTNRTTPVVGSVEFDGTSLYYTDSTPTRQTIATTNSALTYDNFISGLWNMPLLTTNLSGINFNGVVYYVPFIISKPTTITDIGLVVTTGSAGENIRLAIYNSDSNGAPSTIVYETANISAATTGLKSETFSSPITLNPGLYFRASQISVGAVGIRYGATLSILSNTANSTNNNIRTETKSFGAFTSNPTTAFGSGNNGVAILLKVQ